MPSPSRTARDGESSTNASVSGAVDLAAAARIWGGQGLFSVRQTNAIFYFQCGLNCVAPLGMVSTKFQNPSRDFAAVLIKAGRRADNGCGLRVYPEHLP